MVCTYAQGGGAWGAEASGSGEFALCLIALILTVRMWSIRTRREGVRGVRRRAAQAARAVVDVFNPSIFPPHQVRGVCVCVCVCVCDCVCMICVCRYAVFNPSMLPPH